MRVSMNSTAKHKKSDGNRQRPRTHLAADVVEQHIEVSEPFMGLVSKLLLAWMSRAILLTLLVEVLALVVNRHVDVERLPQPLTLLLTAGDRDDLGALELAELADKRTSRAGGTRNDERLARLDFADVEETLGAK
jgi:hypothetical protein